MNKLVSTLFLLICFYGAYGQENILVDRPNVTDAVPTIGKGIFQVEAGYLNQIEKINGLENYFITAPNLSFKYGLIEGIEIRVLTNYIISRDEDDTYEFSGFSPITLSPKFKLIEQNFIVPAISLTTSFTFPNIGEEAFQTDKLNYGFRLLFEHIFNDKYSWAHTFGADWFDTRETTWAYSSAFSMSLSGPVGAFAEFYGNFANDFNSIHGIDTGITYLLNSNMQADAIIGFPLNDNASDIMFGFGLAWRTAPKN